MRYVLGAPVDGGSDWWEISDTKTDYPMATIRKDAPNAEHEARALLNRFNDAADLF